MKKLLLASVLVAAIAAPAEARNAKALEFVGEWCLKESVVNGYDLGTKSYIPNSNYYERATADCPAENRVTVGPHSLDGLEFRGGKDKLFVEGSPGWGKKGKRSARAM